MSIKEHVSKISSLNELHEFINENREVTLKEMLNGLSLPIFSKEDINTFFQGGKVYVPGDITIISYDDDTAIIVDGGLSDESYFELVDRNDIESCVWCPFCRARSDMGNIGCDHLVVIYDALNGDLYFENSSEDRYQWVFEDEDIDVSNLESWFDGEVLSDAGPNYEWRVEYGFKE